jgi:hypothetical protein
MSSDERSSEARRLAEIALVSLIEALVDRHSRLIVVGGLVPETLADSRVPAHLGTTDVDLLVAVHVGDVADVSSVEKALETIGAKRDPKTPDGWRWRIPVGQARVKIEFLCDDTTQPNREAIRLPGCDALAALNLRGTGYVEHDCSEHQITAGSRTVAVMFAGLQGYLLAKAHAVRDRGADKDYYDFAYVLLHNREGGPGAAADRLLTGPFSQEVPMLRSTWTEINGRFHGPASAGSEAYARQALLADPTASEPLLRNDAYAAVSEFISTLGVL